MFNGVVDCLAVTCGCGVDILGASVPAFNFKSGNTGSDKLVNKAYGAKVPGAHHGIGSQFQLMAVFGIDNHVASPAGLHARPAIG